MSPTDAPSSHDPGTRNATVVNPITDEGRRCALSAVRNRASVISDSERYLHNIILAYEARLQQAEAALRAIEKRAWSISFADDIVAMARAALPPAPTGGNDE